MTPDACYNCGLPGAPVRAKVRLRSTSRYRPHSVQTLAFCDPECARQTAFLQLETHSGHDSVTRLLGGQAISYAEFCRTVPVEVVRAGQTVKKTPAETRINTGADEAKKRLMALPHTEASTAALMASQREIEAGVKQTHRKGGRPATGRLSAAEYQRRYRERQRRNGCSFASG